MAVNPTYPKGIVAWTARRDLLDNVLALDPNTLAAEIGAIEGTVGVMPQVEGSPPVGPAITYATVAARIHDIQMGTQRPVCSLTAGNLNVKRSTPGFYRENLFNGAPNAYRKLYDPFGYYNNSDITIRADGWYTVAASQSWPWSPSGWVKMSLVINGNYLRDDFFSWNFPENNENGNWGFQPYVGGIDWQGILHTGDRVRIWSQNGTGSAVIGVGPAYLRVSYDREVSHTQQG